MLNTALIKSLSVRPVFLKEGTGGSEEAAVAAGATAAGVGVAGVGIGCGPSDGGETGGGGS